MPDRWLRTTLILLTLAALVALAVLFAAESPDKNKPLAEVNGEVITAAELDKAVGPSLAKLQEQIYKLRKDKLDALVQERLLAAEAAKRSLTVEALLAAEVEAKVEPVTDEEVKVFYEANKSRLKEEEAALRERIRAYLREQKLEARREAFQNSLRTQANIVIHLEPPEVYRVEVAVEGAPARGPATARVTIVKFEDFHCPYCKRVQSTLAQVLTRYGDKVRIVHRDFPLDNAHPDARKAHEAGRCAHAQGKFWDYHDLLYAHSPKTSPEELKAYARDAGLDLPAFEQCLESGAMAAAVEADVEQGNQLGLTGTPSFFINGRLFSGAQPLGNFVEVIEQELARKP